MARYQVSGIRYQAGYTLLEVLIASSIFVAVLVIGTSSFATANRLRTKILQLQETTQTARFVAETIARDVRAATGKKTAAGGFEQPPFEFQTGGIAKSTPSNGLITTPALKTNRFDPTVGASGTIVSRLYTFTPAAGGGDLTVSKDGASPTSLLPTGFAIKDVKFRGLSHTVDGLRSQPFVQVEFTVVNVAAGTTQTIRTSVVSRELP